MKPTVNGDSVPSPRPQGPPIETLATRGRRGAVRLVFYAVAAVALCGLMGNGVRAAHYISTWDSTSGNWSDAAKWDTPDFPHNNGDTYDAIIGAGEVTLDQEVAIQAFDLTGGTLTGDFNLTTNDLFTWSGGTVSGGGTITGDGGLDLSGDDKYLHRQVSNNGIANWTAGQIYAQDGTLTNNGTLTNSCDAAIHDDGGSNSFHNTTTGTFTKDVTEGTTAIHIPFDNDGTVNVKTGTLFLFGGSTSTGDFNVDSSVYFSSGISFLSTYDLNGPGTVQGAGAVSFMGGTTNLAATYNVSGVTRIMGAAVNFNGPVTNLGATVELGGTLGGSSDVVIEGTCNGFGTMVGTGTTTIASGATIDFVAGKFSRPVINNGTANWRGNVMRAENTFTNNGLFTVSGEGYIQAPPGAGSFHNTATGTFTKDTNSGITTIYVPFNNDGTVNVDGGGLKLSGRGTSAGEFNVTSELEFAKSYDFTGPGAVQGPGTVWFTSYDHLPVNLGTTYDISGATVILRGTVNFNGPVTNLGKYVELYRGTLGGSSDAVAEGSFWWCSGAMAGTGSTTIASGATLTLGDCWPFPGGGKGLYRQVINNGTTNWTMGAIHAWDGTFVNNGTFTAACDEPIEDKGGSNSFENTPTGVFTKHTTDGTTVIEIPCNNDGTVNVQSGTLKLEGGGTGAGTFKVDAGAKLEFNRAYTLETGSTLDNRGTVAVSGYYPFPYPFPLTVHGTVAQISAGTLTGGRWELRNATLEVTGGTNITTNQATVILSGNSTFDRIGTLADNQGSFAILSGCDFTGSGNLANSGTLRAGVASTLTISGDLAMEVGSHYICELGAASFGLLAATGDVLLKPLAEGGTLDDGSTLTLQAIQFLEAPGPETRTILTAAGDGGVIDTFAHEPAESDYLGYGVFCEGMTYVGAPGKVTSVEASVFQALAGDADHDGDVDPADLAKIALYWAPAGTDKGWREGNFDDYQDGNVDPADLALLAVNWSPAGYLPEGSAGPLAAAAAVPEPSTLLLGAMAAALLGIARWRRRRSAR